MAKQNRIFAYTDGSTQHNPGIGGYAAVMVDWNKENILHTYSEFIDITTNNQVELLATIYSVEWFLKNYTEEDSYLVVMSDSKYCTLGYNNRMDYWSTVNWKNVKGKNIKNLYLWQQLYDLKRKAGDRVFFQWIKGHSGDEFNDQADEMCRNEWQRWLKRNKD